MQKSQRTRGHHPLIMIVDDDTILCDFIAVALSEQGYRTVTASNGASALKLLEDELPALILSDAGMPLLDGHQFAAIVHALWGGRVPLVIMSGSVSTEEQRDDMSISAFLTKPFDLEDLFRIVREHAVGPAPATS